MVVSTGLGCVSPVLCVPVISSISSDDDDEELLLSADDEDDGGLDGVDVDIDDDDCVQGERKKELFFFRVVQVAEVVYGAYSSIVLERKP